MAKKSSNAIHVLFRYVDDRKTKIDTVAAHQEVAAKKGEVWLGKVGRPLADQNIERIKSQIDAGILTYLYMAKRVGDKQYIGYQAKLFDITKKAPTSGMPDYYKKNELLPQINLWFHLGELKQLSKNALASLIIASTGKTCLETFPTSVISLFLVKER